MPAARPVTVGDPGERLASGPLPPVLLLCGPETFLVERALRAIRERLGVADDPRTGHTVWGDDATERIGEALQDLGSPGLFGGIRLLVLRRAESLKGAAEERVAEAIERLGADGCGHLVLVAAALDRRRKLFQQVPKDAVHDFAPVSDRHQLAGWVGRLARDRGVRVTNDGAEELVERCGPDLGRLAGELEKLAVVHTGVGVEEVRGAVASTRTRGVDELAASLAAGERAEAIRRLRALLADGEAPLRIVAFLAANLRRALHVAELAETGLGDQAIAGRLKAPVWLVRKQRGRGSAAWLSAALGSLARLDRDLKQSRAPDAVVEAAIAGLTMRRSTGIRRG